MIQCKRRADSPAEAGGKRAKEDTPMPDDASTSAEEAVGLQVKGTRMVDKHYSVNVSGEVYEDYNCTLNQTNISNNTNMFYNIQIIKAKDVYYTLTRWGKVGGVRQEQCKEFNDPADAIKAFQRKFKDKTKNKWRDRFNFEPYDGMYTLIQVKEQYVQPCSLDDATKELVKVIFMSPVTDMMPLGKLTQRQIEKGLAVLEEIQAAINQGSGSDRLKKLSSKFFTEIPHDFGKKTPPTIDSTKFVMEKRVMLREWIQEADDEKKADHPLDQLYRSLNCKLTLLEPDGDRFEIIQGYYKATADNSRNQRIVNVWEIDRKTEVEQFLESNHLKNRRLLWYGSDKKKVVDVLKNGVSLPNGPSDKGICFASQSGMSSVYETLKKNIGVMFLCEVALGKELSITSDNISITEAPPGCDSVVAQGKVEPDPSEDTFINLDGKKVTVPQGRPTELDRFSDSSFKNSQYVIYKKSQCRLRYLVELQSPEN